MFEKRLADRNFSERLSNSNSSRASSHINLPLTTMTHTRDYAITLNECHKSKKKMLEKFSVLETRSMRDKHIFPLPTYVFCFRVFNMVCDVLCSCYVARYIIKTLN